MWAAGSEKEPFVKLCRRGGGGGRRGGGGGGEGGHLGGGVYALRHLF